MLHHDRLEEKGAQVLGISCDTVASHRAWAEAMGGLPYPELSDFQPKGQVSEAYGLYEPQTGASRRAVVLVDKTGIIRYRKVYVAPHLPDIEEILDELDKLNKPQVP